MLEQVSASEPARCSAVPKLLHGKQRENNMDKTVSAVSVLHWQRLWTRKRESHNYTYQ